MTRGLAIFWLVPARCCLSLPFLACQLSTYTATIRWTRKSDGDFTKGQYSRAHEWAFDGGLTVPACPARMSSRRPGPTRPASTRRRRSSPRSRRATCCSSSTSPAARAVLDSYVDEAEGVLEKRADGKMAMTRVTLRPRVTWGGNAAGRSRHRRPPPPRARGLLHRQLGDTTEVTDADQ